MGYYTSVRLDAVLSADAPAEVRHILVEVMLVVADAPADLVLPDHPLFKTPRWNNILTCSYASKPCWRKVEYRPDGGIRVRSASDFKDYHSETELFVAWLQPHLIAQDRPWLVTETEDGHCCTYFTDGRCEIEDTGEGWY